MRKIEFYLEAGLARCIHKEIVEFEDDATDEEINKKYIEWVFNHLYCSWWEVEK